MRALPKLAAGIAGCLLLAGCAGTAGQGERPSFPLPPTKQHCTNCHAGAAAGEPGALKQQPSGLCLTCHADRQPPAEHKVDIVPVMAVPGLPLSDGRMTCVTCHDPHANPFGSLLRKPPTELCLSCHPY